jgi:hypothetical protein
MRNDTFCTTTLVRKKRGEKPGMRTRSLPVAPPPQMITDLSPYTAPITTDIVSSNFDQGEVYNIMW